MHHAAHTPLQGICVVITRPVGQARSMAHKVRALGGRAVSLPGLSLRPVAPAASLKAGLRDALAGDLVVFTSPAAVRFAARVVPLKGRARMATVGQGTARTLHRHGVREVLMPSATQDSEGLLAHPALADVRGLRVAVVGAPGGRGVVQRKLRARGAQVTELWVYRRVPARLDGRHRAALRRLGRRHCVLLSSVETLRCLRAALADADWQRLMAGVAVVSSDRVDAAARQAGFAHRVQARSALAEALLDRAVMWAASAEA